MATLGENLKRILKEKNLSQSDLSRMTNGQVSQANISGLIIRNSEKSSFAPLIAAALDVSMEELVGRNEAALDLIADGKPILSLDLDDELPDSLVQVAEYDVEFSAGNGSFAHYVENKERKKVAYSRDWLQSERLKAEDLRRFPVPRLERVFYCL